MSIHPIIPGGQDGLPIPPSLLHELRQALRSIRYGTIEIVIHDGRVVQLERREKIHFEHGVTEHKSQS